jgi:hypothetical protein
VLNSRTISAACLLPVLLLVLSGCHSRSAHASTSTAQARNEQRAESETQREELDRIPPPSKSTFMAIHTFDSWQNPVITVQPGMLELQVTLADGNTSSLGVGGMLRPIGARRQELNITADTLGSAITAIPQTAWPYGRVVAIVEANKTPPSAEPAVRRNLEITMSKLNDLGIVVYDLTDGRLQ